MPRKSKAADQDQPVEDLESSSYSNLNESEVGVDVQQQTGGGILDQASQLLNGAIPAPKLSKNQRYKANVKARKQATAASAEDFSTIIITMLTLILSAWPAPDDLKPNEDEVGAFSVPMTRLLLRHIPIASKFSADALDALGMIGALSAYYVRTGPARKKYQLAAQAQKEADILPAYDNDDPFKYRGPVIDDQSLPVPVEALS